MPIRDRAAPFLAFALCCAVAAPALAQSCGQEADRLAQQYALNADEARSGSTGAPATPSAPPATTESQGVTTTDKLARSGGVISPPDVGTSMAIQPPKANPDNMPTAPQVEPSPPAAAGAADSKGLSAADRTRMESLLMAARAAERQGKAEQCLERLREAEAVPGVTGSSRSH
jgi:hypothetical protein